MVTPLNLLKIPQVLGAAMAANVFITIATQMKGVALHDWQSICLLGYCFSLNLKDFFDDMKAYEISDMEGFSLFPTVFFRVMSYIALAWAATTVPAVDSGFMALAVYFGIFLLWCVTSILRRMSLNSSSKENLARLRRRKKWLILYSFGLLGCVIASITSGSSAMVFTMIFLIAVFREDFNDSGSFTSSINETL